MSFYCDSGLEYRDYAIFDLTDVDKTKEDFWDPEEEFYDIWSFEDYLFNQDGALMRGEDVEDTLNGLSSEVKELRAFKEKVLALINKKIEDSQTMDCDFCKYCVGDRVLSELKEEINDALQGY